MKNYIFITFLVSSLVFIGCKNETKEATPEIKTVETTLEKDKDVAAVTGVEFEDPKIGSAYTAYINLKKALVYTDNVKASAAASNLMTAFANVGVDKELLQATQNLQDAADVEVQRKEFVSITKGVEKMIDGALTSGTIYKQYCPMAFGNTGAYWLSESKEIRNPYFGDKMLKCGRVESKIE
ncbi:DUF3347 domain-containing protein [Cochleicola gelatinilyticus]|uniref:DUF3347 domain-containing protein n=1 Tax=Cochleicola gelatinilyticus TaxID=1763537 RepID=A0A167ILF3_9FLAO|nr:DUF3347 domain-containing protein [Cochleicola gelatinilyticus]OAB79792.1 hypothetical protein ULVI_03340 [Cochleicola gelatinilyticus]